MAQLFYGDNLEILRDHVPDESIDLIYLDPPFNSNANYNVLFKSPAGVAADSQIEAFEDSWHYGPEAAQAFHEVMTSGNTELANLLRAMQEFLGQNDMMAYLAMMAVRLIELHRVLKPTGSLYLHCDPTASHYLKLLLDSVFGGGAYRNEIVWQRLSGAKADAGQYGRNSDRLFFYTKSADYVFHAPRHKEHNSRTIEDWYKSQDARGRYVSRPLTAAGATGGDSGQPWRGKAPTGHWTVPRILQARYETETGTPLIGSVRERLEILADAGYIDFSASGLPSWRRYLDEAETPRIHDIWADDEVKSIARTSDERLGYPTQKPVGLLERVIAASSNPGDVVLDPFCGCGTAVHAAQKLGRRWLGIDVTYLAIGLIERRLNEAFPGIQFEIVGEPRGLMDAEHLAASEPHQFQFWITQKIGGQPYQGGRKGADRGIDGYIYYTRNEAHAGKSSTAAAIISVKAGRNIGVAMVRELKGVLQREKADIGIFVCVATPTREMEREAAAAGIWTDPVTRIDYPRLQLFTLADLFQGRQPSVPLLDRQAGYKRAKTEDSSKQGSLL